MQSKQLLIAVAAFAVTATGASAYGGALLNRADLTDDQRIAIEEAHELRAEGELDAARDVLVDAGIDEEVLSKMRKAHKGLNSDVKAAIEAEDYDAFEAAAADSRITELITSAADFEQLVEAHSLRGAGDKDEAREIMESLGFGSHHKHHHRGWRGHVLNELSDDQREAFMTAKQANDRATMQAILDEAGVSRGR